MTEAVEQLVESLLHEGYALYPYTPGATKNATPTPFGIVYPPAYAAECPGAFDHARLECVALAGPGATLSASLRYLVATGKRHEAAEQRVELGPIPLGERNTLAFDGGRLTLRSTPGPEGRTLVRCCVHNTRQVPAGLTRSEALARSLLSTQLLRADLLGPVRLAARIGLRQRQHLPGAHRYARRDRARYDDRAARPSAAGARESRGTVRLDGDRGGAAAPHPGAERRRARRDRARRPRRQGDGLQGRRGDAAGDRPPARPRDAARPGSPPSPRPSRPGSPTRPPASPKRRSTGSDSLPVRTWFCGLGPMRISTRGCSTAGPRRSSGSWSISTDKIHLGVTIDDDPGQELLRETGRYLYFFAPEVEVIDG